MNKKLKASLIYPYRIEGILIEDGCNFLKFGKMIAAANCPESRIILCRLNIELPGECSSVSFPRPFQSPKLFCPLVELNLVLTQIRLKKPHTTADIISNQVWIE